MSEIEVRKITKVANDVPAITLPKEIMEKAGMEIGDYVKIYVDRKKRVILEVVQ